MMKWRQALLGFYLAPIYLLSICELANSQELPAATSDGRYGTKCYYTRQHSGDLCQVSFYALLAAPERYHGRHLAVAGYLIQISDRLVLFASKQSYESGVEGEGIALLDAKLSPQLKSQVQQGVWPMVVAGTFDAKFSWDLHPRLGAMRNIFNVFSSRRVQFELKQK